MQKTCETNISSYRWFIASSSLLFWFPVFFLYFSSKVSINQVLILEAFYYACVVVLEVPSGYLSDVLGRRITLITSSICVFCSYVVFFIANDFVLLMVAQGLLAAHISFKSGTDSALLFESLSQCNRESEIGDELAKAQRFGLLATAIAALSGGLIGGLNLALPYAFSAVAAVATVFLSINFVEPSTSKRHSAKSVPAQAKEIIHYLKQPRLAWLFVFSIIIFVLVHVPYEYFQPYIKLVFTDTTDYDRSPLVAGILICLTMLAGSYASNYSIPLRTRFGVGTALLLTVFISLLIISVMAFFLHSLVLSILLLRSVPMALSSPIIQSVLHESITDQIRASFLSTLSLFSRLAFSLTLLATALFLGNLETLNYDQLRQILAGYCILTIVIIPLLWLFRGKLD